MKKLLVTAVASAIILPVTVSAAATLYGKIHMAVEYNDNNTSSTQGTNYSSMVLASRGSRIGVKGNEDLGNGLKLGYLIEWGVGMDGGKDLDSRNRGINLSSSFGTALIGKWDTPLKTLGGKLGVFRDTIGDVRNLGVSSGAVGWGKIGTIDQRAPNVIAYVTPDFSGFSSTLAYVTDYTNAEGDNDNTDAFSANAIYKNGPLFLGGGYSNYDGNGVDDAETWRVGGSYKIAGFKVTASYTDMTSANFTKDLDPDIWRLAGAYTMGSNTFKIQYADRSESGLSSSSCTGGLATSKCQDSANIWAIGFDHKMSKRTKLYLAYAHTSNDKDSASSSWNNTGGGSIKPALGNDADAFALGIMHKF